MFAVHKVAVLHHLKHASAVFVREKTGPQNKAVEFRLFVLLLNRSDRKKNPSSKKLFYTTFFFQGKQVMKLLSICIFPINIHPKPVK